MYFNNFNNITCIILVIHVHTIIITIQNICFECISIISKNNIYIILLKIISNNIIITTTTIKNICLEYIVKNYLVNNLATVQYKHDINRI